jgi:outer membrane receptor protein involved in Fe transport
MKYVAPKSQGKAWCVSPIGAAVAGLLYGASYAPVLQAQAAPAASASSATLEEIVVTATRRAQTVQEIPFNISAVSGAALEKSNIVDSVDALRTMAGVAMYDRGYRNAGVTNGIIIRGMNVDAGTNGDVPLAAPPAVATYVDNTALFGNFILKDIERIEVLRGPQGTLYGSGSLAGNVRYIMKKPDLSAFSGKASFSYGQTDGSDGHNLNPDLLVNIPLGGTAALRANIGQVKNDGIVDYPNLYTLDGNGDPVATGGDVVNGLPIYRSAKDVDTVDLKYGRASLLFKPSDTFNAQLSYQRQKDEVGGRRQVTRGDSLLTGSPYGKYELGAIQVEPSSRTVELAALEMEVDLAFATLTSSTSHYKHTGTGISDNSGVYARNGWFSFYGSSPRPDAQAERFYDDSAFTQELRLVSNGHHHVDWTGGVFYTKEDYSLGQNSYLVGYLPYMNDPAVLVCGVPCTTNQDFLFRRNQTYKEMAAYGEATINFTDRAHLTLGGRYFKNKVDVDAIVDVPIYSSPTNPPGVAAKSIDDNGLLFKANMAWDVSQHSMVYATFSQGYRHAGANAVPTSGKYAENPALFTFDSDKNDNFELGYKGTSGKMAFAVSGFYTDWKNPQLNTATSNWGFFAAINAKSARTAGLEAELSGSLTDSLSYNLSYTYVDAKLTADVYQPAGNYYGGPLYTDRVAANGDRLPGTAQNVLSGSLQHNVKLSGGFSLTTVLSGYYQSGSVNSIGDDNCLFPSATTTERCLDSARPPTATSPNPNYAPNSVYSRSFARIDGFQLWNLSSTLSKDAWAASLFIKNVLNDAGTTGKVPYAAAGPRVSPAGVVSATQRYYGNNSRDYIALPRTIGISVSYTF